MLNIDKTIQTIKEDRCHIDRLDWSHVKAIVNEIVSRRLADLMVPHGGEEVCDAGDLDATSFGDLWDPQTVFRVADWHLHAGWEALFYLVHEDDCGIEVR